MSRTRDCASPALAQASPWRDYPSKCAAGKFILLGNLNDQPDILQHHRHGLTAFFMACVDHGAALGVHFPGEVPGLRERATDGFLELGLHFIERMAFAVEEDGLRGKPFTGDVGRLRVFSG